MTNDPIVAEIRQTRENILKECGDDLDKLLDRYKAAEEKDSNRLISVETLRQRRKQTSDPAAELKSS